MPPALAESHHRGEEGSEAALDALQQSQAGGMVPRVPRQTELPGQFRPQLPPQSEEEVTFACFLQQVQCGWG